MQFWTCSCIFRTLVTYARTIFKPSCCLNFQSMRTQAESTYIAHDMFGQIKMEIPWYINRHTLISRKRDGKPRMIGGQLLLCVLGSTNSASLQTPLILCFKSAVNSCMGIACPVWTARTYNSHPRSPYIPHRNSINGQASTQIWAYEGYSTYRIYR